MFNLKKEVLGIRSGEIKNGSKIATTPCFFITSDFGGGGTNVSRLIAYSDLMLDTNFHLLMNYYYLDINSKLSPRFDTKLVREFSTMQDIIDFIQRVKEEYLLGDNKKAVSNFVHSNKKWSPIVLLDSGSGNILRDELRTGGISKKNYKQKYDLIVKEFFDFIVLHKFDMGIAIDFAAKNTLKDNEAKDKDYLKGLKIFSNKNSELIDVTLKEIKKHKGINIYVPLHGNSLKEYLNHLSEVIKIEKREHVSFAGLAIGGLGNPKIINGKKWELPEVTNAKVKGMLYLHKLIKSIRDSLKKLGDNRPIHVLGAASPFNLIPLLMAGADSFDCHSAWRRASDGNETSKEIVLASLEKEVKNIIKAGSSKILAPLLDSKGQFIVSNSKFFLEFVDLYKVNSSNFSCDCPVCAKYSIIDIKKLYSGKTEENYFAKILIYLHSIYQYEAISKKMTEFKSEKEIIDFLNNIPASDYKTNIKEFLKYI